MPSLSMSPLSIFLWALLLSVGQTRIIRRPNHRTTKDSEMDRQLTAKPSESAGLFQGDIAGIPNATEYLEQYNDAMNQSLKVDRHGNAVKSPYGKWPQGTIPYTIDENVPTGTKRAVASAMKEIQEKTCIKFVPRSNERDYANIIKGKGCYSTVGATHRGPEPLSLGDGCGDDHSTAVHELMHLIGFFHEHARNDRDSYVNIYWNHMLESDKLSFRKFELDVITHLGTPYDYGSVMHYRNHEAGINGQVTIGAKGKPLMPLGNYIGLSKNDALKINLLYECKEKIKEAKSITAIPDGPCVDLGVKGVNQCASWAAGGACGGNPAINIGCRKSCNLC